MKLERIATGAGIIAFVFSAGMGWQNLNSKIERLDERLSGIEDRAADQTCLTIISRQVIAIERGKHEVREQLEKLAHAGGCYRQHEVEVYTATRPSTSEEIAARRNEEQRAREVFNRTMANIDEQLDLHPRPTK